MSRFIRMLVILTAFAAPVRATLIVSYLSGNVVRHFDDQGNPLPGTGSGGEGVACTTGTVQALFLADNSSSIHVLDPLTLNPIGTVMLIRTGTTPAGSIAALALSNDGSTLYAADYGSGYLLAVSTTALFNAATNNVPTVTASAFVATSASHDVAVDASGNVYSAHFQHGNLGVEKYSPTLTSLGQFLTQAQANAAGITNPAGLLVTPAGIFVSNFTSVPCPASNCAAVVQFDLSGTPLHKSEAPSGSKNPIGLALGPPGDNDVYVALLGSDQIGVIDVNGGTFNMSIFINNAGTQPKYLQFTENCTSTTNAFIEVCKRSSLTDPVTGNFTFFATAGSFTTGAITIPPGVCSGPIGVPAGTVKVTEAAVTGTGVSSITAYGYNANTGVVENRLVSSDLANRFTNVTVPSGGIANETIVEFTNYKVPTGVIEVCKEATPGVTGNFSFEVAGAANNPYSVPAGACSGPILVQVGAVTITEAPRPGFSLSGVTTIPSNRLVSINVGAGSAVVQAAPGGVADETVVRFANAPTATGQLKLCKIAGPGVVIGQTFTITVNGTPYTVPAGPAATGGDCIVDGTFAVGSVVTVAEAPPPPYQVLTMSANPPSRANGAPVISGGNGQLSVTIGSGFTEVTVTNIGSTPLGQLKICKVAGTFGVQGNNFSFTVANGGTTQTYTVPAGPSPAGYCIADGTFPIGTHLTVAELPATGFGVSGVSINGVAQPSGTTSATITVGNGITEVAFTNAVRRGAANAPQFLSLVNYQVVSRTDDSVTYRADLLNAGPALASVHATVASVDDSVRVVDGRDVLDFVPVPANSEVSSGGTFTVATNGAIDFSKLKWTLEAKPLPHHRAAGK